MNIGLDEYLDGDRERHELARETEERNRERFDLGDEHEGQARLDRAELQIRAILLTALEPESFRASLVAALVVGEVTAAPNWPELEKLARHMSSQVATVLDDLGKEE
jgi:hypothetical protein